MGNIEEPPEDFDGDVDIQQFWDMVCLEMISRGLVTSEYEGNSPNSILFVRS